MPMSAEIMSQNNSEYSNIEICSTNVDHLNCKLDIPNETEFAEKLAALRLAVSEVPDLYTPLDDEFLSRFLRTKKFVVEDALKVLLQYFENKRRSDDDLSSLTFFIVKDNYKKNIVVPLPIRHPSGASIIFMRLALWDPSTIKLEELIMTTFFLLEEVTCSEQAQLHGIILILDTRDLSFRTMGNILKQMTLRRIKLLISLFQGGYPAKFKGVHGIVNSQNFCSIVLGMVNPFMKEKLRKRIHLHGKDLKSLHKMISPTMLPKLLGGTLESSEDTALMNSMFSKEAYYNDLSNFGFGKQDS